MKTADAFHSYYTLYHLKKIRIRQKFKNISKKKKHFKNEKLKKNLDHYIIIFKVSKIHRKIQNNTLIVKHDHTQSSAKALQIKETFKVISILFPSIVYTAICKLFQQLQSSNLSFSQIS